MESVRPEGTEDQSVTSPSEEALGRKFHMSRSEYIIKYTQRYEPGFGATIEWQSDYVASIVYMIQDEDFNRNVDAYEILLLLAEWYTEDFMDTALAFHMR